MVDIATKDEMINAINAFMDKLITNGVGGGKAIIFESGVSLAASAIKNYSIKTSFPNWNKYNLLSCPITVLIRDDNPISPTLGKYVNSEAYLSVGVDANGNITIANNSDVSVLFTIMVGSPTKAL